MFQQPWKLIPNKVRSEGGREIDFFRGAPEQGDTQNGAEAWIGSVTRANGVTSESPNLGCSKVDLPDGTRRYLFEVIQEAPEKVLGNTHIKRFGMDLGILIKLLDAKSQFLLQCHPTREVAKRLWNSDYGKEECWHILSIRNDVPEPPYIRLGFKSGITRKKFEHLYQTGDIEGLEVLCHKFAVKPGETYFVPAGMPHALGVGCFVVEIQEPSDLTAVPLKQNKLLSFRRRANPKGVFTPIDDELYEKRMLESFDYKGYSLDELKHITRCKNKIINQGCWGRETLIIGLEHTPFFSATLMEVTGTTPLSSTGDIRIGLVTRGKGEIVSNDGKLCIQRGSEVFFPYDIKDTQLFGDFSILLFNPPAV